MNEHLPADLIARVEERVFLDPGPDESTSAGGVAVAEPLVIHVEDEPTSQGYIEIIDAGSGNRVLTVIEVLSPANKHAGEGQELYRRKQHELKAGGVSLVEIDLLRAGQRVLAIAEAQIPPQYRTPYAISVRRAWRPGMYEFYPISLRRVLPRFRIPLRETDMDAILDVQSLIERCYRNGRYYTLDYTKAPEPPLRGEDADWAAELLHNAGRR